MSINELFDRALNTAHKRGFYDDLKGFDHLLAPALSEVQELKDAYRNGNVDDFNEEFADVLIAFGSIARFMNVDLDKFLTSKMEYNELRKDKAK